MSDGSKKAPFGGLPIRSVLVGLIGLQSAYGLTLDIPRLGGENADYVGTLIDAGFFSYCTAQLATQAGVLKLQDDAAIAPLGGVRCNVALSVGREPGTWMPKEWAASGGRLSLPLSVSFTDEPVDLGFPGEEPLGGRRARKLECEGGSFVGPQGEVKVRAEGGAWSSLPTGREGEYVLRFFIDFPEEASRNDVRLPAGRVFFSGVCWDERGADIAANAPDSVGLLAGPRGLQFKTDGQLTIRKESTGLQYLATAFGEVFLILGRFSVSAAEAALRVGERIEVQWVMDDGSTSWYAGEVARLVGPAGRPSIAYDDDSKSEEVELVKGDLWRRPGEEAERF